MKLMNVLIVMIVMVSACKKNTGPGIEVPSNTTGRENRIAALTKEVAEVLEQVYESNEACYEVNAAILSGYYADERVLLRDLLLPEQSDLYRSPNFKKLQPDTGVFRKKFCEIIEHGNYPLLLAELRPVLLTKTKPLNMVVSESQLPTDEVRVLSGSEMVSIYFPYSENFAAINFGDSLRLPGKIAIMLKPTLVYTDRDADSVPGRDPYNCPGAPGKLCYRNVMVDDGYAEGRATHIVGVGANINERTTTVPKSGLVYRVYHGSSRLKKQMDKLVSLTGNGGGSEVKVCRVNGYLRRTDEHITEFAGDVVTLQYSRADIRKKRWKRVFSVWDPNWNYEDTEQVYAVYEDDNRGMKKVEGSLKTILTQPATIGRVEGDIGFEIQVSTQDEIITQRKLDRQSFLRDGRNNQGWGFLPDTSDFLAVNSDWPIFDGGTIWEYTLPYRIY